MSILPYEIKERRLLVQAQCLLKLAVIPALQTDLPKSLPIASGMTPCKAGFTDALITWVIFIGHSIT